MYEYKITLPFKIVNCVDCPFRHQKVVYEPIESMDKISGVTQVMRIESFCMTKDEQILRSESVESYNSSCPLKGCVKEVNNND